MSLKMKNGGYISLKEETGTTVDNVLCKILEDLESGKIGAKERLYKYVTEETKRTGVVYSELFFENLGIEQPEGYRAVVDEYYKQKNREWAEKKRAEEQLRKPVEDGIISTNHYNKSTEKYSAIHRTNEGKKDRELSRKRKSGLSVVILFISMLCGLVYVIEQYGKGVALLYIFLWLWAISYVLSN